MKTQVRRSGTVLGLATLMVFVVSSLLAGCGTKDPQLQQPIQEYSSVDLKTAVATVKPNSKVDILFIVDNSLSMDPHQDNLARNIDGFLSGFAQNSVIDFHAGVVSIYDSLKCVTSDDGSPSSHSFHFNFDQDISLNHIQCPPNGELRPLIDPSTGQTLTQNFVTRDTPNYIEVLRKGIEMGTKHGPEFEELLSPVEAAFSNAMLAGPNKDFYRSDAKLALVFLSDADDNSPGLTPEQVYSELYQLKSANGAQSARSKISVYEIGSLQGPREPSCAMDTAGQPPKRMLEFEQLAGGAKMSLCDPNFGEKLTEIGNQLSEEVGRQVISLNDIPDMHVGIQVTYGTQVIPEDAKKGWTYNEADQVLYISGHVRLNAEPGATLSIHYVPVDLTQAGMGHVKSVLTP